MTTVVTSATEIETETMYGGKAPKNTRTDRKTAGQGALSTKVYLKSTHVYTRQAY